MTYIGFVTIRNRFCNFYPAATVSLEMNAISRLNDETRHDLFPKYANIEILFARNADPEDVFQNGGLYILDIDEDKITENLNAMGELKRTEKRVSFSDVTIHASREYLFYPVIEVDDRESALDCFGEKDTAEVLLQDKGHLMGPVVIELNGDEVTVKDEREHFIVDEYVADATRFYIITDYVKDIPSICYVDLNGLTPVKKDVITDEALLVELHRILREQGEEGFRAEAAFAGLDIPSDIMFSRINRITELFHRHKNIESLLSELSDVVVDILTDSVKFNRPKVIDFLSTLDLGFHDTESTAKQDELEALRASIDAEKKHLEELNTSIETGRKQLEELNQSIEAGKKRLHKMKKFSLDDQIKAAQQRVDSLREELASTEAELKRLKLIRDEEAMKELAGVIADSGRSVAEIIEVIKGLPHLGGSV